MHELKGQISFTSNVVDAGLRVRAFDRDLRKLHQLGEATTDRDGNYAIKYEHVLDAAEHKGPDLVIHVVDANGKVIAASRTLFNAGTEARIDLVVDGLKHPPLAEFDRVLRDVLVVAANVPVMKLTDDDLEFLAGELELPHDRLRFLRLDARWGLENNVAAGAFYALLRGELPTDLPKLLSYGRPRWESLLKAAIARNILATKFGGMLEAVLDRLEALAIEHAFVAPAEGPAPIGTLLAGSPLSMEQQKEVVRLYLREAGGSAPEIWENLASSGSLRMMAG